MIPCRWCGNPTSLCGASECSFCYAIRTQVQDADPTVLAKMLILLEKIEEVEAAIAAYKAKEKAK